MGSERAISGGYGLPAISPTVSPAAATVRTAAIVADPQAYEIPRAPSRIWNQGSLSCCVSCAMAAAVESLGRDSSTLSPLFHYFVTRFEMGGADATGNLDLGVSLYEAATRGICALKAHDVPFDEAGIAIRPSAQAYADAKTRALGGNPFDLPYVRADGVSRSTWIREQIRLDRPVLIGFRIPGPYPDSFLDRTFQWADPNAFPSLATGHCVLATGFSDARLAVHVLDSRGGQMFDGGRWWMGYRVIDSGIVSEIYAIRR